MSEVFSIDSLLEMGKVLEDRSHMPDSETGSMLLARTVLKVRNRDGERVALAANAAQRMFERGRGRLNIVVKARQMGITTWVAGRFFLKTITSPGVLTVQVAHTREAAEGIFRIVQRFWEDLPQELRRGPLSRSRANVGQMVFKQLDSEFRVLSASDDNAGRGLTIQNLHCSEVSRWPGDAAGTLAGLRAALSPDGELVMESTPNGAYGCFYEQWLQAQERGVVKHFFPWWMEPAYMAAAAVDFRQDETDLIRKHGLSARQIGFRRALEASYRGLRSQEFAEDAETCFRATGECCFDLAVVEQRLEAVSEPVEVRRDGALLIWLPPLPGKQYLVSVDTAGGGADGDFAAVQVIELQTGLQCAELRQRLGALELARAATALAREYATSSGRDALIAVERNNHGAGVIAYLDGVEHYSNLYEQAGVPGWLTTAASKPAMVGRIGALLLESPWLFSSKRLLGECRSFVTHGGGRTGAASGAHDDCLMAMALAQAVRAEKLQTSRAA